MLIDLLISYVSADCLYDVKLIYLVKSALEYLILFMGD
jgi:hypothetical protein